MARINNSRKALFTSPSLTGNNDEQNLSLGMLADKPNERKLDIAEKALANFHAENEFISSSKENHKERMAKLRLLLNEIEEDNWKYDNVSKLIGI